MRRAEWKRRRFFLPCAAVLLQFAAGCGSHVTPSGPPPDRDLTLYTDSGRVELARGAIPLAAQSFDKALQRARAMDDASAIADTAYSLAICQATLGKLPAAQTLLREASHEARRANRRLIDILLLDARVSLLQGQTAQAKSTAAMVLNQPKVTDEDRLQVRVLNVACACKDADLGTAQVELAAAKELDARTKEDGLHGIVAGAEGDVRLLSHNPAAAAADYDRQADLLRSSEQYRNLPSVLSKAGRAYLAAGNASAAADRLYRAARVASGAGDANAPALVIEAAKVAKEAGDAEVAKLVEELVPPAPATLPGAATQASPTTSPDGL